MRSIKVKRDQPNRAEVRARKLRQDRARFAALDADAAAHRHNDPAARLARETEEFDAAIKEAQAAERAKWEAQIMEQRRGRIGTAMILDILGREKRTRKGETK